MFALDSMASYMHMLDCFPKQNIGKYPRLFSSSHNSFFIYNFKWLHSSHDTFDHTPYTKIKCHGLPVTSIEPVLTLRTNQIKYL
jgi:hypothetical protein